MAFTDPEIAEHAAVIEQLLWSQRRPPVQMRDKIREGQCFTGQTIEFFYVRPAFNRPGVEVEEPIAKVQHVRSRGVWRIFWKRADDKWHAYPPCAEVKSLADALRVIDADESGCFFG